MKDSWMCRTTAFGPDNSTSKWLAGLRVEEFPGANTEVKIANAAASIGSDILSPAAVSFSGTPSDPVYIPFTTKDMIRQSHTLGMKVKPWTVNQLNVAEQLMDWDVDGIITDYPSHMRRFVQQRGDSVAPKYPKRRVLECLNRV